MEAFVKKFEIEKLLIKKIGAWNISLRPVQVTLGSLVLSLDRHCPLMSGLTAKEASDLATAFSEIDKLFAKTFKPEKINYLALMMVDEQVHFHVIPRYKKAIEFNGDYYDDKNWPNPPVLTENIELSKATLTALLGYFR